MHIAPCGTAVSGDGVPPTGRHFGRKDRERPPHVARRTNGLLAVSSCGDVRGVQQVPRHSDMLGPFRSSALRTLPAAVLTRLGPPLATLYMVQTTRGRVTEQCATGRGYRLTLCAAPLSCPSHWLIARPASEALRNVRRIVGSSRWQRYRPTARQLPHRA